MRTMELVALLEGAFGMADIKHILVTCEKLLAELEKEFPQLTKVAHGAGWAITGAGVNHTLSHISNSAKNHDSNRDDHSVHE